MMGAGNVRRAYARWAHIDAVPFKLLAYMAVTSLDADDPPRFWEGRESLAVALGRYEIPDLPASDDESEEADRARKCRRRHFTAVAAALGRLVEVGAIECVANGCPGRNSEYVLRLSTGAPSQDQPLPSVPFDQAQPLSFREPNQAEPDRRQAQPVTGQAEHDHGRGSASTRGQHHDHKEQPAGASSRRRSRYEGSRPGYCVHEQPQGMKILGSGNQAARACASCDREHPVVDAAVAS